MFPAWHASLLSAYCIHLGAYAACVIEYSTWAENHHQCDVPIGGDQTTHIQLFVSARACVDTCALSHEFWGVEKIYTSMCIGGANALGVMCDGVATSGFQGVLVGKLRVGAVFAVSSNTQCFAQ